MNSLTQFKKISIPPFLIALMLFALAQNTQAVSPPPDGGYSNFTTAEGDKALFSLTSGAANTAVGWFSLKSVITGSFNTAVGAGTLVLNTGDEDTATGAGALLGNTTGFANTADGAFALFVNSTGSFNTANGVDALRANTTGGSNTAIGVDALSTNVTASGNTAVGTRALVGNVADDNSAFGFLALESNTSGNENTAIGEQALRNNTTGNNNIALGYGAGLNLTGDNNIDIGNNGFDDDSGTIRIGDSCCQDGNTFIAGISGALSPDGIPVYINSDGRLGTLGSSERFKRDITNMEKTSEAILLLRPVTFQYKMDTKSTPQFGLIAEEVAKVNPALVLPDKEGRPYTVRYDAVNAMLLNEFLKEHRKVEQMQKQIEALTAVVQKVSAQLEVSKSTPQTVLNNR